LCARGEWAAAEPIYFSAYVPEMVVKLPDWECHQVVVTNHANCLVHLRRPADALTALSLLKEAVRKHAEYYVARSLASLNSGDAIAAEMAAREGLATYPGDSDLLCNLTASLFLQKRYSEALVAAQTRLQYVRDGTGLNHLAVSLRALAEQCLARSEARELREMAISHLREAKELNAYDQNARSNLAGLLCELERHDEALFELAELSRLRVDPVLLPKCRDIGERCVARLFES
jgi:tetratricopeptide (TPR) repeat protein